MTCNLAAEGKIGEKSRGFFFFQFIEESSILDEVKDVLNMCFHIAAYK